VFFTNLTAIVISADLGYLLAGVRPRHGMHEEEQLARVRRRVIAILALLTVVRAAQQARLRKDARTELARLMAGSPPRRLDHVELRTAADEAWISASISTPDFIDPGQVGSWERSLSERLGQPVHLELQQIQLARADERESGLARNYLAAGVVQPVASPSPRPPYRQLLDLQRPVQDSLESLLRPAGLVPLVQAVGAREDGSVFVLALACGGNDPGPGAWPVAASVLARDVGSPVRLQVTIVKGTDHVVRFAPGGDTPPPREARDLRRFAERGPEVTSSRLAFAPSPSADESLSRRRLERLAALVPSVTTPCPLQGPPHESGVRVYRVDTVDSAAGTPSGPSPGPTPGPSPQKAGPAPPASSPR
jgi:hypothetical protein